MSQSLMPLLGTCAVLLGVAISWYARFRFIANDAGESPFAGRRWRPFPPSELFRQPGFTVFVVGAVLGLGGVVVLIVCLFR
jgi:hypothetical protein